MTIEALAFRAADRITRLAKGGEISALPDLAFHSEGFSCIL